MYLSEIQRRVANVTIGNTTLRNQGAGSAKIARNYLSNLPLTKFSEISEAEQFNLLLDEFTNDLKAKLSNQSWGAARKALNIFLFECCMNKYISNNYDLDKIFEFLEVPLDNPNGKRLKNEAKKLGIKLRWVNIKKLEREDNAKIQDYASILAKNEYNCPRAYLDVLFWRSE